ncbi:MAG: helix-turn-helix domain-containing protein [Rhodomicrobium sp.]
MRDGPEKTEGARERKRRETLRRIAETGLKLFAEKGYDATTLEDIAEAADISPRTFFYYFKTKDEILKFWQGSGILDALRPTLLAEDKHQSPLDTVEHCLLKLISRYESEKAVVVDRIFNSSETLRARKQAIYFAMEQMVFETLCELWPEPERRAELRMVAMMSIGAMRLAMEARRQQDGQRALAAYLRDSFAILRGQIL